MKAVVIESYGTEEALDLRRDVPPPRPARGQVLVAVHAAGVNPLDVRLRRGELRWLAAQSFPLVLGNDASGVVSELGEGVTRWKVGDRVCGMFDAAPRPECGGFARPGCYAELAVTREDTLARVPPQMDFCEAAALPLVALTAAQALHERAVVRPGMRVLIVGASGGVGQMAVQLAMQAGAQVDAVCGGQGDLVRELGVRQVFDYRQTPLERISGPYDLVYDVAVAGSYRRCRHMLSPRGTYLANVLSLAVLARRLLNPVFRHQVDAVWVRPDGDRLQPLVDLASEGRLKVRVDRRFPLESVREAHAHLASGRAAGKVVLQVAD